MWSLLPELKIKYLSLGAGSLRGTDLGWQSQFRLTGLGTDACVMSTPSLEGNPWDPLQKHESGAEVHSCHFCRKELVSPVRGGVADASLLPSHSASCFCRNMPETEPRYKEQDPTQTASVTANALVPTG